MPTPEAALRRRRPLVDVPAALNMVALVVKWMSFTLLVPAAVALIYGESEQPFLWTFAISFIIGLALERVTGGAETIGIREGALVVAVGWLAASAVGALPYVFEGGDAARPVDAYFEAMSGFTTTGASIMSDIEGHGHALLFWRGLTQWLGGMGIIVLALAILPKLTVGGRQLMENESPGPEFDKLAPRIRDTAKQLWLLYIGFSVLQVALLWGGELVAGSGMSLFNSIAHTFTTMATGGFSPEGRSLEGFSAYTQWICVLFMVIAGANFGLWYRAMFRSRKWLRRDEEFRAYLLIILVASALVAVALFEDGLYGVHDTIRHSVFQVVSLMTTTGYGSVDFVQWNLPLAFAVLLGVMLVGGCAGSTGGSIKVVRWLVVWRACRRDLATFAHPERVAPIRVSGLTVEERAVRAALSFTLLYLLLLAAGIVALLLDVARTGLEVSTFQVISDAVTTIGNVGPGIGFTGPMGSFSPYSDVSTIVMTVLMWLGRLELLPVMVLLTRGYWRR